MGNNSLPYQVVHCSSWDDEYNPEQLAENSPGNQVEPYQQTICKGWQTPRYPEYPQDLIINLLSGASRISKVQILSHHFKIATKIDVYIGILKDPQDVLENIAPDTPPCDDGDNMLVEFTRLGYVCFDNNARAQYRAQELKSIKINADGDYLRLVIRNCHSNRLNTYNQVNILALNILGQPLHLFDKNDMISPTSLTQQSPFDNRSILSASTRRTSVSSTHSQVDRLPTTTSTAQLELQQWTEALLRAENEAVQDESYQIAKTYKNIGDKLKPFAKILSDLEVAKRYAVETKDYDEAEKIKDDINEIKQAAHDLMEKARICIQDGRVVPLWADDVSPQIQHDVATFFDHEPYPTTTEDTLIEESSKYIPTHDPDSIPEPIMDEERIPYTLPIRIFGEETVACVLSIKTICRTRGLTYIEQHIIKEINKDVVHATLFMMQEAVIDSREQIVCQAINVWRQIQLIGTKADLDCMERAFGVLLKRTSDSNVNIRQEATELVLTLVDDYPLMSFYVCKPERLIHNSKEAKARVELVEKTVSTREVQLEDALAFVVAYLNHGHEDVKQAAVQLLLTLSDKFGFHRVSAYIDEPLRRTLADSVKKLVDKDPSFRKGSATKDTLLELRALTVSQPEMKDVPRVKKKATREKNSTNSAKKPTTRSTAKPTSREKPKPAVVVQHEDEASECIFCNEVNPEFNEDTLVGHYYNTCPVLTNCPMCETITEIPSLNDHMLEECNKKHLRKKCATCQQAIPVEQWLQHTLKKTCNDKMQCPLCLIAIEPANEQGWKSHLKTGEGCSKLKKSRSPNKKKPSTTSSLRKKTIKK